MENWKVREVTSENKSQAQVEEELLEKAGTENTTEEVVETTEVSDKNIDESANNKEVPVTEDSPSPQLTEEQVLSFLKNRYDSDIASLDEFKNKQDTSGELPTEVSNYLSFNKNTGKGFDEFIKYNRDLKEVDPDELIREYYAEIKPHLDPEDLDFEISDEFGFDESIDDETFVRKRKIAKKEAHKKAQDYFSDLKSKYFTTTESVDSGKSDLNENNVSEQGVDQSEITKRNDVFTSKTDKYFKDFEGFGYEIGDSVVKYNSGDLDKTKNNHSDLNNFISMHLTEDGYLKDAESYHKALAAAFNPDGFAKFFYEKGKSDGITADVKATKNIDMGLRSKPVISQASKFKVSSVSSSDGNSLKIKSNKNK